MSRHYLAAVALIVTSIVQSAFGADTIAEAINQQPPAIDIRTGIEIPSEGYCDQPYVVKLPSNVWLCTMTTGKGHEGQTGQHIVSCRSSNRGETWDRLVDIEPADGPEASWVMPYLTTYGRVYVFYTYNAANMREVIGGGKRVDTLGQYALKYSDDGGKSWSRERWFIPVREGSIDRRNAYGGKVRFFWGVGKPMRHKNAMYLGYSKVGKFGKGFLETTESWFLRCANIDTERNPAKLQWQTLPEGDVGLVSPEGPIAEEVNLTSLSDGSLFCTYRTTAGHPCHAYSRDDGKTWTTSEFMTDGPGGKLLDHPRAANFVRKLTEGPHAGRFIYWFHNHGGRSYLGRNPAYLLGGVEIDGPEGKVIQWGDPVAILYDRDPKVRISYPDFIWDDGLYITETQKSIARVHLIPDPLLRSLWQDPPVRPNYKAYGEGAANRMQQVAQNRRIVYTELADYLVKRFDLSETPGIGIDIGGGPGEQIIHLAKRTRQYYWINADINTWCAGPFAENALKEKVAHRVGFVFADACALPFRDDYADIILSRGSYQFWPDLEKGLSEILRVLRSGGAAFVGRGAAPTMPETEFRRLAKSGRIGGPKYDPDKDAETFRGLMRKLGVQEYEVIRHKPTDPNLNYGVWVCFRKP